MKTKYTVTNIFDKDGSILNDIISKYLMSFLDNELYDSIIDLNL